MQFSRLLSYISSSTCKNPIWTQPKRKWWSFVYLWHMFCCFLKATGMLKLIHHILHYIFLQYNFTFSNNRGFKIFIINIFLILCQNSKGWGGIYNYPYHAFLLQGHSFSLIYAFFQLENLCHRCYLDCNSLMHGEKQLDIIVLQIKFTWNN